MHNRLARDMLLLFGTTFAYFLNDQFLTAQSAPLDAIVSASPGPGLLVKSTDSADNASIANALSIGGVVGDLDPAYYYTGNDGNGFSRTLNRALIAYPVGTAWMGWSNSTTLATAAMLYGAKERSAYVAGVEKAQALVTGDPAHIIILRNTGALHICRVGLQNYMCYPYRNGSDATLWPAILGSVCDYSSVYVYDVDPPTPTAEIASVGATDTFTHPLSSFIFEVTVTARSGVADTYIQVGKQDADNTLWVYITAAGALQLYRRVGGSNTLEKAIFGNGVVANGSHLVIQFTAPTNLVTTSGNNFKVWCGSSFYESTLGGVAQGLIDANANGGIGNLPAATTLNNLATWKITL